MLSEPVDIRDGVVLEHLDKLARRLARPEVESIHAEHQRTGLRQMQRHLPSHELDHLRTVRLRTREFAQCAQHPGDVLAVRVRHRRKPVTLQHGHDLARPALEIHPAVVELIRLLQPEQPYEVILRDFIRRPSRLALNEHRRLFKPVLAQCGHDR